jgi:hypothetical protein
MTPTSGVPAAVAYRARVPGEAVLALDDVKVNRRPARVYAFADRIEVVDRHGLRTVRLTDVMRITNKTGLRRGRITVIVEGGDRIEIRSLRSADTPVAFRLLVELARGANR